MKLQEKRRQRSIGEKRQDLRVWAEHFAKIKGIREKDVIKAISRRRKWDPDFKEDILDLAVAVRRSKEKTTPLRVFLRAGH